MKEILEAITKEELVPEPAKGNAALYGLTDLASIRTIDPEKLATFLAKQQEDTDKRFEDMAEAINSVQVGVIKRTETLAVTENPDGTIDYKGAIYIKAIDRR